MALLKKKPPVSLAQWLEDNDRNQRWLSKRVGISIAQASRIVRGLQMPRARLALKIQEVTGGRVTVETLLKARAKQRPQAAPRSSPPILENATPE